LTLAGYRITLTMMRIRGAALMAVWLGVTVVSSAVMTCVPRAAQLPASRMPACAGMSTEEPCLAPDVPADCCTRHDPSLSVRKTDFLTSPLQATSSWLAWLAPVVLVPTTVSVIAGKSPPEPISNLGPRPHIALSALRV
jgi:hypothetical protein